MFTLISEERVIPNTAKTPQLRQLLDYWKERRGARRMPRREDVDLDEIGVLPGRIHLLDALSPTEFRYRIYGTNLTNPDRRDMTGLTTRDYNDTAFGAMVTRHLGEVMMQATPLCLHIRATLDGIAYEYYRLAMPLSPDDVSVTMLLVGSERVTVPTHLLR